MIAAGSGVASLKVRNRTKPCVFRTKSLLALMWGILFVRRVRLALGRILHCKLSSGAIRFGGCHCVQRGGAAH